MVLKENSLSVGEHNFFIHFMIWSQTFLHYDVFTLLRVYGHHHLKKTLKHCTLLTQRAGRSCRTSRLNIGGDESFVEQLFNEHPQVWCLISMSRCWVSSRGSIKNQWYNNIIITSSEQPTAALQLKLVRL